MDDILLDPDAAAKACPVAVAEHIQHCAEKIVAAKRQGRSIMLNYGAHLLRNGTALILDRFMKHGWLTHLATNGAGTIHDWGICVVRVHRPRAWK